MPRSTKSTSSAKAPAGAKTASGAKDGTGAHVAEPDAVGATAPDAETAEAGATANGSTEAAPTAAAPTGSESPASEPRTAAAPLAPRTKVAAKPVPKPIVRSATDPFLLAQREALMSERGNYVTQAEELKAQADSLALEHEPGDVQFDEEGGEGGTSNVDRELDLLLSAQARGAVEEIDRALGKIDVGTYGRCEQCGLDIPEARLEALPHASLCVVCKAGGLSSRR